MDILKAKKKTLYIGQFLAALEYRLSSQLICLEANIRRAILITAIPKIYWRTKHIEVQYY